jgi:hypothetical protein
MRCPGARPAIGEECSKAMARKQVQDLHWLGVLPVRMIGA